MTHIRYGISDARRMLRALLAVLAICAAFLVWLLLSPAFATSAPSAIRFDFTVNIAALIAFGTLAGTGIGAWVTTRWRLSAAEGAIVDLKTKNAAIAATLDIAEKRTEEVRAKGAKELADFKLEVAKDYATNSAIAQIEERLITAIDRLGDRLDNHFSSRPLPRPGGAPRK